MQGLTDGPRSGLTEAQVRAALTGEGVRRDYGCDVQYGGTGPWFDISASLNAPWTVRHDNTAEVHGSLTIDLVDEFAWGRDRFRPWMTLTTLDGTTSLYYAGVFILSTPTRNHGRTPAVFKCTGKDLLTLATRQVGDTFVADANTTYLSQLRTVLTSAGITDTPLLDGTAQSTTLPYTMVWALSNERWIDIANALMQGIAYTDVFMSETGIPRAQPVADTATRATEWVFDTKDSSTDLIAADYGETLDLWVAYNSWTFVRQNMPTMPADGDGIHKVTNQSDGPSSVDSVGLNPAPVQYLDVADQASLVAEGNRIIAADRRAEQEFRLSVDPLPIAGHRDVVELRNSVGRFKVQVSSWELNPLGRGAWVLGGGAGGTGTTAAATSTATGTVTQASPLRVVVDGASTDSPANSLDGSAYTVGARVTVTVRNPIPPLVMGVESAAS